MRVPRVVDPRSGMASAERRSPSPVPVGNGAESEGVSLMPEYGKIGIRLWSRYLSDGSCLLDMRFLSA